MIHITTVGITGMTRYVNSEHNTVAADEQKQLSRSTSLALVVITMARTMTVDTKCTA